MSLLILPAGLLGFTSICVSGCAKTETDTHQELRKPNQTFIYDDIVHVLQNTEITLQLKWKFTNISSQ